MSRRMKVVVALLAAAMLVTAGSAAAVMAQDGDTPPADGGPIVEVAAALGVSVDDLAAAIGQAQQQVVEQAFTGTLHALQERGAVTAEEAAALADWWALRPRTQDGGAGKAWMEQRPDVAEPRAVRHLLQTVQKVGGRMVRLHEEPRLFGAVVQKTAEILGIPAEDVLNAFRRVFQQAGRAALTERLQQAVAEGRITVEQAERIRLQAHRGRARLEGARRLRLSGDALGELLPRAVEAGRVTPEEAEQIQAWWQQRPEALGRLFGERTGGE